MGTRRTAQGGFTFFELVLTVSLLAAGIAVALDVYGSSDALVAQGRARLRASARYREAQAALATILRGVAIDSLPNLDAPGLAKKPTFERVLGYTDGAVEYSETLELYFEETGAPIPGVGAHGHVVVGPPGGPTSVVAENVVQDSFRVRQEGRNLVVHLRVFDASNGRDVATFEGESNVSLRN